MVQAEQYKDEQELSPEIKEDHAGDLLESCLQLFVTTVRTADDFLDAFSVKDIMESLQEAPDIRAAILERCTRLDPEVGKDLKVETATEILQRALDNKKTTSLEILSVFTPNCAVNFLPWPLLSNFLLTCRNWQTVPRDNAEEYATAVNFVHSAIVKAVDLELMGYDRLRDWIGIEELVRCLTAEHLDHLRKIAITAAKQCKQDVLLTGKTLYSILGMPGEQLVCSLVPLLDLHQKVLVRLADHCDWTKPAKGEAAGSDEKKKGSVTSLVERRHTLKPTAPKNDEPAATPEGEPSPGVA
jgi:hypothetical protein